ncbi:hypothetical protein HZH68_010332 [Vespula germanica]|uniref:Uncharacterized protein n=2 Tax=Vespula TaxID=7451 RepID=A0A834N419_VESGE|nr:hypothetical protein HZH68_010332 [Vespula germanica]KAF7416669.1 hypothetical protein H0235_011200 [Vespula pensylvanica]
MTGNSIRRDLVTTNALNHSIIGLGDSMNGARKRFTLDRLYASNTPVVTMVVVTTTMVVQAPTATAPMAPVAATAAPISKGADLENS